MGPSGRPGKMGPTGPKGEPVRESLWGALSSLCIHFLNCLVEWVPSFILFCMKVLFCDISAIGFEMLMK